MSTHAKKIADQIVALTCIEEAMTVVTEVIGEEQVKHDEQIDEKIQVVDAESARIGENIIDTMVTSSVKTFCTDVYEDEQETSKERVLESEAMAQGQTILVSVVRDEVTTIASSFISEATKDRAYLNLEIWHKKKLGSYFARWIKAYKRQQFIKSSLIGALFELRFLAGYHNFFHTVYFHSTSWYGEAKYILQP